MNLPALSDETVFWVFIFGIFAMTAVLLYDYYKCDKKKAK